MASLTFSIKGISEMQFQILLELKSSRDHHLRNVCFQSIIYVVVIQSTDTVYLSIVGWFKNPVSSQTEKLMAGTKFSDYVGLNHYKKAKK